MTTEGSNFKPDGLIRGGMNRNTDRPRGGVRQDRRTCACRSREPRRKPERRQQPAHAPYPMPWALHVAVPCVAPPGQSQNVVLAGVQLTPDEQSPGSYSQLG